MSISNITLNTQLNRVQIVKDVITITACNNTLQQHSISCIHTSLSHFYFAFKQQTLLELQQSAREVCQTWKNGCDKHYTSHKWELEHNGFQTTCSEIYWTDVRYKQQILKNVCKPEILTKSVHEHHTLKVWWTSECMKLRQYGSFNYLLGRNSEVVK